MWTALGFLCLLLLAAPLVISAAYIVLGILFFLLGEAWRVVRAVTCSEPSSPGSF